MSTQQQRSHKRVRLVSGLSIDAIYNIRIDEIAAMDIED